VKAVTVVKVVKAVTVVKVVKAVKVVKVSRPLTPVLRAQIPQSVKYNRS
jgi:hypothetical protein